LLAIAGATDSGFGGRVHTQIAWAKLRLRDLRAY
jgi:hypothetical protein